jgi:hypothetical protein
MRTLQDSVGQEEEARGEGVAGEFRLNTTDPIKNRQRASQDRWLEAYAALGGISAACTAASVGRSTVFEWDRHDSQGFSARYEAARAVFREALEQQMFDRLSDPSGNRGSDVLLIFALKNIWKDKYGETSVLPDDTARELLARLRSGGKRREEVGKAGAGSEEGAAPGAGG